MTLVRKENKYGKPTMQAREQRKASPSDLHYRPTSELRSHDNVLYVVLYSYYPGIVYGCQMDFVKDWPQYALEGEASHYLEKHKVLGDITDQTR